MEDLLDRPDVVGDHLGDGELINGLAGRADRAMKMDVGARRG